MGFTGKVWGPKVRGWVYWDRFGGSIIIITGFKAFINTNTCFRAFIGTNPCFKACIGMNTCPKAFIGVTKALRVQVPNNHILIVILK